MSKTELVELIAKEAGLTKADAARALDATLAGITAGLNFCMMCMKRLLKQQLHPEVRSIL